MVRVTLLALVWILTSGAGSRLPDALAAGWQGKQACELLSQADDYRVLKCTFPPGSGHERHFHPANFGYALSGGVMRITDAKGTREATIEVGSNFKSPGTEWHEALNVGTTTVSYLIIEEWPAVTEG